MWGVKNLWGSLPPPVLHHVRLPFLMEEVINRLSLIFSKVRIGLGRESTTFHHDLPFLPWERLYRVWDTGSSPWSGSLEVPGRGPAVG